MFGQLQKITHTSLQLNTAKSITYYITKGQLQKITHTSLQLITAKSTTYYITKKGKNRSLTNFMHNSLNIGTLFKLEILHEKEKHQIEGAIRVQQQALHTLFSFPSVHCMRTGTARCSQGNRSRF
jgi:hypothetical protein